MANEGHPVYCGSCGSIVQAGDQFCGVCGSRTLPPATQAEQVIPKPVLASQDSTDRSHRRSLFLASVLGALIMLLVGGGVLAFLGIGFISANAPPDPAFDLYLPALKSQTDAPIMLPAELPNELENIVIDESVKGGSYRITFLSTPPDELVGGGGMFETVGTLTGVPTSEFEPHPGFKVTSTEDMELPDATEAKLRYMEPVSETAMFSARWEGTFDRDGYTYTLATFPGKNGKEVTEQALSTMVEVER